MFKTRFLSMLVLLAAVVTGAMAQNYIDLSTLAGDYVAQNGDVLTGTLNGSERPYKISIADGAAVTLDNATINGVAGYASDPMKAMMGMYDGFYQWCGLTCEGDATIILKDGTENAVKGFFMQYPGIYVPENKTLTIKGGAAGTGKLTAQNGTMGVMPGTAAGIGAGCGLSCGHINIQGGEITATGQSDSAGIGGASSGNCGNITISGGKINATGDGNAAGIGGGAFMSCGDITIESTVISVTATSGSSNACSIGKGYNGSCGTVTIGGTEYSGGTSSGTFTYLVLTDGGLITALDTYKGQTINVAYSRSFTSGKTSTVCLPFAYTKKEGDGSFYAFTNIEKSGSGEYVATMTEPVSTTLTANTPYLYLPNATGDVDFGGAYTIPATLTAGSTTSGDWTFQGTYTGEQWTTAPTGIYGFSGQTVGGISQGQFVKVGAYVKIAPMRCYLENASFAGARSENGANDETLPETIKVRLISTNGEVTAIGTMQTKTGEVTLDNDDWYSLDGRRIQNPTKGVYIKNGRKVVIK